MTKPHIIFAHQRWKELVKPGDIVIDATCGNGHDTLFLAQLALRSNSGILYAFDIQVQAIETSKTLLKQHLKPEILNNIILINQCHSGFPDNIAQNTVALIVYNLGYLPRSDKKITTLTETTIESITSAMSLIKKSGLICITCYPGHAEGKQEEEKLLEFVSCLDRSKWHFSHHRWLFRKDSPSVIMIKHS